jgi:hypothetical protein
MRKLTGILTLVFGMTASAVGNVSYHDSYEKIDTFIKSKKWDKLSSSELMQELRSLTEDDRFRMANALQKEGVLDRTLFFEAKHKIGKLQEKIKSGTLSEKDLALHKLSLFLISDTEVN